MNEENNIVTGIKKGDSETLHAIYKDHFGMIRNLVMKNSGSESDAEDVFQDALVVLFKKFNHSKFNLTVKFKTYFYSVCRNIWLTELKKRGGKWARMKDYEQHVELGYEFTLNWKEDTGRSHPENGTSNEVPWRKVPANFVDVLLSKIFNARNCIGIRICRFGFCQDTEIQMYSST